MKKLPEVLMIMMGILTTRRSPDRIHHLQRKNRCSHLKSKFMIMKSKFTSLQVFVAAIIVLISATATHAQNLHHDWTDTGTGTITNLQNMTVLENGDRYVAERTDGGGFSVAKYNDRGDSVWRTPYAPMYESSTYEPVATAYNLGAIFVLCKANDSNVAVVKFSGNDGLQFLNEGYRGGGFIHNSRGIVADPVGTGVIVTYMVRYTDPEYWDERQNTMFTIKYDADLNEVWDEWAVQSLGLLGWIQNPRPTPRAFTTDLDGNIYVTGVFDVEIAPDMPPYRTCAANAFTLKYNSLGVREWIEETPAEPSITNFGYDNDYDATGTYMVYQSVPSHLVDEPASTGMTVLTKRNLDGSRWLPQRRPSRIRNLDIPDYEGTSVHPNVLAVDKTTSSAYIVYDEVSASSVAVEKYDATGVMQWPQHISIGESTSVQSVILDKFRNVVVGVNNDILGSYGIFIFGPSGNFIDKIEVPGKLLKQLLVDDHNHIHALGTISSSTTSYFLSRFSLELAPGFSNVPELLMPIGAFDLELFGHGLEECWTGINVNWDCLRPPYCFDPEINALLSYQGKTNWEASFAKPIDTSLPQSKDFRTFSLNVKDGKAYKQVLQIDDKLLKNGVTQLSFKTNSINRSVDLNIATDGAQIPVTVSMLNLQGKTLWTGQFTAPFQKQLTDKLNEPVAFISINGPEDQASLTYYPNPSNGAFKVMLDPQLILPAELAVYDMKGFRIHQQMLKEPQASINLSGQKPGLYVLHVKNGAKEIRELIQIK